MPEMPDLKTKRTPGRQAKPWDHLAVELSEAHDPAIRLRIFDRLKSRQD